MGATFGRPIAPLSPHLAARYSSQIATTFAKFEKLFMETPNPLLNLPFFISKDRDDWVWVDPWRVWHLKTEKQAMSAEFQTLCEEPYSPRVRETIIGLYEAVLQSSKAEAIDPLSGCPNRAIHRIFMGMILVRRFRLNLESTRDLNDLLNKGVSAYITILVRYRAIQAPLHNRHNDVFDRITAAAAAAAATPAAATATPAAAAVGAGLGFPGGLPPSTGA